MELLFVLRYIVETRGDKNSLRSGYELTKNMNRSHARGNSCVVRRRATSTGLGAVGRRCGNESGKRGYNILQEDGKVDRIFSRDTAGVASKLRLTVVFRIADRFTEAVAGILTRSRNVSPINVSKRTFMW